MSALPARVVGGYWTYWGNPIRLKDIPTGYNTVYLFHATPVGGAPGSTGAVQWNNPSNGRGAATNFNADLAEFRKTRAAILTVGGANANVDLSNRTRAQAFLDSIKRIYTQLGGFDGLDWNNYEGSQTPNTDQMIWISQQLKATYGQQFAITSPPAPWRDADLTHCRKMIDAGVMDMVAPQFYDGPGLADQQAILNYMNTWISRMGGASKVGVGYGLNPGAANYSTQITVTNTWTNLIKSYPALRGAFDWDMPTDENLGWPFGRACSAVIMAGASTKPPVTPPITPTSPATGGSSSSYVVKAGDTYRSIAAQYGLTWEDLAAANPGTTPEGLRVGQVLVIPGTGGGAPSGPSGPTGSTGSTGGSTGPAPSGTDRLPARLVGTYWFHVSGLRLNLLHTRYNVAWIAFADWTGSGGHVQFDKNVRPDKATFKSDMAALRRRNPAPKIILSSFGSGTTGPLLTNNTNTDQFSADIIAICKDYDFDGFDWDLEAADRFTAAMLERATRTIATEMRKTKPGFIITAASHLGPSKTDFAWNNNGRIYADFAARCKDVIDMVQPQYYNRDNRVNQVSYIEQETRDWLATGLREDQIGYLWMIAPSAIAVSDSQLVTVDYVNQVWASVSKKWPGVRGMGNWSLTLDQANNWRFAQTVGPVVASTPGGGKPGGSTPTTPSGPTGSTGVSGPSGPTSSTGATGGGDATYTTVAGDTIGSVASKLGLPAPNPMFKDVKLAPGQVIQLGTTEPTGPTGPTGGTTIDYVVKSGDTFRSIAAAHGISDWTVLQNANPGVSPETLRVGQVLKVPRV